MVISWNHSVFFVSLRWTFLPVYDKNPFMLIPDDLKFDDKGLIPARDHDVHRHHAVGARLRHRTNRNDVIFR